MENNNYLFTNAISAYQKASKAVADRKEEKRNFILAAIEEEATAGNFFLLEEHLHEELIEELRNRGFKVTYFYGVLRLGGCYKISWEEINEK